jgi:hypothetical protein
MIAFGWSTEPQKIEHMARDSEKPSHLQKILAKNDLYQPVASYRLEL